MQQLAESVPMIRSRLLSMNNPLPSMTESNLVMSQIDQVGCGNLNKD